jgi:hypothetical protein
MSEHAMHAQMPQLLKGFGFRGAIMRTHYMMYGYNPCFDVPIGWWIGLDGSRVATVPTYKGEGAQFGKTTVDNWILTRYPSKDAPKSPADFRREFRRIQPLLASRADDAGLRKEELVKECEGKPGFRILRNTAPCFLLHRKRLSHNGFVSVYPGAIAAMIGMSRRAGVSFYGGRAPRCRSGG